MKVFLFKQDRWTYLMFKSVVLLPATPSVVLVMKVAFRIPGKKIV
jgi:hypothetical protein